ncbi:hypothetical protein [Streptomyces sp. RFCAC02]|uniref:hypothetical protein n=1 Tax=Streptomyces sp. RFCAC02 TaxID=2499143 RepID=UPI00101F1D89|nr:hypothetical protein [Streptomyces sp. RFCAC02]
MSRTGDGRERCAAGDGDSRARGAAAVRVLLALVVLLLSAAGVCAPAAHALADAPRAAVAEETRDLPPTDWDAPGDTCRSGPVTGVNSLPPVPVALHVPPDDPPPPAVRPAAPRGIGGPLHDAAPAVDLHRLQVHRT